MANASQRAMWIAEAVHLWAKHQNTAPAQEPEHSHTLVSYRRFVADHGLGWAEPHIKQVQYDLMTFAINHP